MPNLVLRLNGSPAENYQLDFTTPGISPRNANARKHRRQTPNLRRNARGRPHRLQRLCCRVENFGVFLSFTRFAVVAICLFNPRYFLKLFDRENAVYAP
jgi:hypothetical protein